MPLHEPAIMTEAGRPGVIRSTQEFLEASPATSPISTLSGDDDSPSTSNSRENPRELRNKAEKQRRDKLNQSITELASMVPPVVAASRKIDKTGVLRLTAHFLRSHYYVFGDTIGSRSGEFRSECAQAVLKLFDGFLLTTTYKGIVVVVSQNVQQYLGYTELELLGQNVFTIVHEDDHKALRYQLLPRTQVLGPNGELIIPDLPDGKSMVAKVLAGEKRRFIIRFKKHTQRSEPVQYVTCQVEGSLRKSDRACRSSNRCCPMVRRARARGDNPCSSGNDVVFIGLVRPVVDTFKKESQMEQFVMEYRTRHSIDGQIIECEKRISLVTGYMTDEVHGINAMNFMHRDDVRWVIVALRDMYDQHRLYGESCYRLMMKNGQFVYMKTRGRLEVDHRTKEVTSFVCTNTVIQPAEGKYLIKQMKKKCTMLINNNEEPQQEPEVTDTDDGTLPVEDPKQLEKVILHLVTNLPSPLPDENDRRFLTEGDDDKPVHLVIIPPQRENIVSGIEKIGTLIKTTNKSRANLEDDTDDIDCMEEIPQSSQQSDVSFESDTPPASDSAQQGPLPNISTITGKNYTHANMEDFGEAFQNIESTSQEPTAGGLPEVLTPGTFVEYAARQSNQPANYTVTQPDEDCQIVDLDAPGPSTSAAGTKRPMDNPVEDENAKKKPAHAQIEPDEALNGRSSLILESLFNEAILESEFAHIDDALICLETAVDPFSDLLIS